MSPFSRLPPYSLLMIGLTLTRVIGWGSTYYALPLLVEPMARELVIGPEFSFAGITILLVTGALLGPAVGRHLDREGTRRAMWIGSVICGLGFGALAATQGPVSYLASWFVLGIGHALMLGNVGSVTIAQLMGEQARRVIGLMMLATGLASSIFWPLAAALTETYGWRGCWLAFAALQIIVALPIHLCIPVGPGTRPSATGISGAAVTAPKECVQPQERRRIFWLLALTFSASGLVSWGLPLHLIALLKETGLSQVTAVALASLAGPAMLLARAVDTVAGERLSVERTALFSLALGPLSCVVMALAPGSVAMSVTFVICFNAAMGVISIARATLPLVLFGPQGFGSMLGRLAVPQNMAFAAAPLLFAVLMERLGGQTTLMVSAGIQIIGFFAMIVLLRRLTRP